MPTTIKIDREHDAHPGKHHAHPFLGAGSNEIDVLFPMPAHHATRADLDKDIAKVINSLNCVRQEISAISAKELVTTDGMLALSGTARYITNAMVFNVKRYYHAKEEGLRTKREREYSALGKPSCSNRIKRALITARYSLEIQVAIMALGRDSRIRKLQDALDKVEMHGWIAMLTDGGTVPHWAWRMV
ncbi:hypothetical protein FSARC_3859 [Fusarium sarcochroum]|uniref:Uncharacterized protein n=1 Tax=Fusarium sarcochroum TaxID=1208366 RepID=A0A8H4U3J6_9HYPO|nr:hypothetical protein FSARC_3859 [Fusarium sarcochroum]